MSVVLVLVTIAVLALLVLLGWLFSHLRDESPPGGGSALPGEQAAAQLQPRPAAAGQPEAAGAAEAAEPDKDVRFRMQGERGMGGPIYGDVLCADGVYLPHVWEQDMHASFDGRWIRTGFYDSETAHLVDRKSRRSWLLDPQQAAALEFVHWRLPRWSGETINESGLADDAHVVMSDASFEAWLKQHLTSEARPLVEVRDLWVPAESLPATVQAKPPVLPLPPAGKSAPQLTLERHWPHSLRHLLHPLEPLQQPHWQVLLDGAAQPWVVDENSQLAWREDGQAFAMYAYAAQSEEESPQLRLVVWSAQRGWQQWPDAMPADRKSWVVGLYLPPKPAADDTAARRPPEQQALAWEGELVVQRVEVDTPETQRLYDGTSLSCAVSDIDGCASHGGDGRVQLKPVPRVRFCWLRDLDKPEQWRARSEPVRGQRLVWTLRKSALDEPGETPAYSLQWGESHLTGNWALEHVVVQGRWAVLMPHGKAPVRGGSGAVQVWDGERLQRVELPWPVVRLRPVPGRGSGMAARVALVALTGCVESKDSDPGTASWHWPVHSISTSHLARPDWSPVYGVYEIEADAHGRWQLAPRWREVNQIQHPCADADYVWRDVVRGDTLWWWGGLHQNASNQWEEELPRVDGICVTRSGAVLCGTGPCACPHPAGEGWAVLEPLGRTHAGPGPWKLLWLNPDEKEVRSLTLQARLPLLLDWDAQGLHWRDTGMRSEQDEAGAEPRHQVITEHMWKRAEVEKLRQGPQHLWLRKQDLNHAEAVLARDDWPWQRPRR